ncbi:MAG TPA: hypothetical protein VIC52_08370 [Actinomycetota bacterium]|jgi:hypothetical protein
MHRPALFLILSGASLSLISLIFALRAPLMARIVSDPERTKKAHRWIAVSVAAGGILLIAIGLARCSGPVVALAITSLAIAGGGLFTTLFPDPWVRAVRRYSPNARSGAAAQDRSGPSKDVARLAGAFGVALGGGFLIYVASLC